LEPVELVWFEGADPVELVSFPTGRVELVSFPTGVVALVLLDELVALVELLEFPEETIGAD